MLLIVPMFNLKVNALGSAERIEKDQAKIYHEETKELMQEIGTRKNYAKCTYVNEAIDKMIEIEGERVIKDIFNTLKNKNRRCLNYFAMKTLEMKNKECISALLIYMSPDAAEDLSKDPNYQYYKNILEELTKQPFKQEGDCNNLSKWWKENKKNYKFKLSDESVENIFENIEKNKRQKKEREDKYRQKGIKAP
jgi:hypothetical protein